VEEWTVINETPQVAHPFHIHVNPFQIIEVFDPNTMTTPLKLNPPFVWWDTFPIPNAKDGTAGYFKMRSRFVDFTGGFVHHCHILEHEDRGMMQLVRVCRDLNNCGKRPNMSHH
jgi:FtsP/CotA-like multicopper oxidase with cupredoxin domain